MERGEGTRRGGRVDQNSQTQGGNLFVQGEPGKRMEWRRPISSSSLAPSPSPAATRAHALEPNVSGGLRCRPRQQLTAQSACPHLHNLPLRPTLQRSCLGPRVGEGDPKCEEKNQQLLPTPLARHSVHQRNTPSDNPWHPAPPESPHPTTSQPRKGFAHSSSAFSPRTHLETENQTTSSQRQASVLVPGNNIFG